MAEDSSRKDACDAEMLKLEAWIGRREEVADIIGPGPMRGLWALLDLNDAPPADGDPLPPGAHWFYFHAPARQSELGPDGHPRRGSFLPPVALSRRMWAGGRLSFGAPLHVGEAARRASEIARVQAKKGRSGALVFVTVRHRIVGPEGLAVTEEQDLVYREVARLGSGAPREAALADAAWRRTLTPDSVMLFRYSALTFNGHRIHYDRTYAVETEGYPGLVVHGPLVATLMMELARAHSGRELAAFEFRMIGPLFEGRPLTVAGRPAGPEAAELWVADDQGAVAATATARLAPARHSG